MKLRDTLSALIVPAGAIGAVLLFIYINGMMSKEIRQDIERVPGQIRQMERVKLGGENKLAEAMKAESAFLESYAKKEQWHKDLLKAQEAIDQSKALWQQKLEPIYENNDADDEPNALLYLRQIKEHEKTVTALAQKPARRAGSLIEARDNAPAHYHKGQQSIDEVITLYHELETALRDSATRFPGKAKDLEEKRSVLHGKLVESKEFYINLEDEYLAISKGTANYALLADSSASLTQSLTDYRDRHKDTLAKIDELDHSLIRVLSDQRIDHHVVIGRASWCEYDGCGDGKTLYTKPIKISDKVYELLEKDGAFVASGNTRRVTASRNKAAWDKIQFDRYFEWPRMHNYAEFWLEDITSKGYHKYVEVVDGKLVEPKDWIEVPEEVFWEHEENLGLAILSKPYGLYESEALAKAQPPGMAMIATPSVSGEKATGANQYGEWRHDGSQSYWHYLGAYAILNSLMSGNDRYSLSDWKAYNKRDERQHYYGGHGYYGTYGSRTYNNHRYKDSSWSKKYSSSSSIRGAGPSIRGKGPGGMGK